jgi:mitogen-activated protein kinase 15
MTMLENISIIKSRQLKSLFINANPIELDLLAKLLQFNPNKRITVLEALQHPYVADFHEEDKETIYGKRAIIPIEDNIKLSSKEYRQMIYDDITKKKKENRKKFQTKI